MQRRTSILLPLLLCAALLLAACGGASSPASTDRAEGTAASSAARPQPNRLPDAPRAPQPAASAAASTDAQPYAAEAEAAEASQAAGGVAPSVAEAPRADRDPPPGRSYPERRPPARSEPPYDSTYFQNYGVNPFVDADVDPLSTFGMDIDTASYGVMRRFLSDGYLPDPDSVRVEEYVNALDYDYPQPDPGSNFAIYTESAPSPFGGVGYEMVQIGIQAREIAPEERAPTSLTFVIDVSGSMDREDRLETVKDALTLLVEQLRPDDRIGIVIYGDYAQSILPPTSGVDKDRILSALYNLRPGGSTNVEAGLDIGFAQAEEAFVRGSNMILLCSDGVANNGVTDPQALLQKYDRYTSQGIKLSTFGFGMGNYNDILMEELANNGNGFYSYIDTLDEAHRLFVDNLTGTLQLVARGAKIQVEFNPNVVQRYRLLGYENRDVADQDFRNDVVDAGEVGAGHSVTALYEVKRWEGARGELGTVRIRYTKPNNTAVIEEQRAIDERSQVGSIERATPQFRLAVSVAGYAELLRHERWAQGPVLDNIRDLAYGAQRELRGARDVDEFVWLLDQAARLAPAE